MRVITYEFANVILKKLCVNGVQVIGVCEVSLIYLWKNIITIFYKHLTPKHSSIYSSPIRAI